MQMKPLKAPNDLKFIIALLINLLRLNISRNTSLLDMVTGIR